MARLTRRELVLGAAASTAALYLRVPGQLSIAAPAAGWDDAAYWAFADRMQALLEPSWRPDRRGYFPATRLGETSYNANLLYTHAAAARAGHVGPARQDARARILVERLCESPPWLATAPGSDAGCPSAQPAATAAGDQTHACGWGDNLDSTVRQHVVIDTAVVRGLAEAYRARRQLGLPEQAVAMIRDRVGKAANSTFYAYPALRLNQINWPVEIYSHAVDVLGKPHLLQHDCRLQLARFADALTHPAPGERIPNTGPGYRFHYAPQASATHPLNVDCAEYATIVCGALLFYGQARHAGMAALSDAQLTRLRAWVARVLCGYWTHGGYLNWDTGYGFARWHQVKKPPLSAQSLLAIALSPRFQPSPAYGRWAKYIFDRSLTLMDRIVGERGGLPPAVLFGVTRTASDPGDPELAVARVQSNAAQAVSYGLARVGAEEPPPLYAYDPDIGRLAITTPAYNTALIAVNQGAFPYGGMEPARLFDADQRVVASTGGRPPSSFGVTVRELRTGRVTATQHGRRRPDLAHPPLRLLHAPRGAVAQPRAYPPRAYAGPFSEIVSRGVTRGPTATISTRHRFFARHLELSWRIAPHGGGAHDVQVLFPSWGSDATVTAVLLDGRRVPVTRAGGPALESVAWFHVAGRESGYVVIPRGRRLPGHARLLAADPQDTDPLAGPSLAFELIRAGRLRTLHLSAVIAPARDAAEAALAARRLSPTTAQ